MIAKKRRTGLTFAPEASEQKMRERLGKKIDMETLEKVAKEAFSSGWKRIKLYFMIGLPGELQADLDGIIRIARRITSLKREVGGKKASATLSINNFIPKSHTPFQWLSMESRQNLESKQEYLRKSVHERRMKLDFQDINISFLEAALSRGGNELCNIIYDSWKGGARFDCWSEHLKIEVWKESFLQAGMELDAYATRGFSFDDVLPWDFIDPGIPKSYLIEEAHKAAAY
ncbi:MAG: hypothetical protein HQ579_08725 [Candidatus Omnitrophica bacterium]|nr:hypothetical protein [Candidatus Omnitrophota bacterium]